MIIVVTTRNCNYSSQRFFRQTLFPFSFFLLWFRTAKVVFFSKTIGQEMFLGSGTRQFGGFGSYAVESFNQSLNKIKE